jgi:hypothetical protein
MWDGVFFCAVLILYRKEVKKIMKKNILGAAIGAGLLLALVVPVMAADDCSNSTTGAESHNKCIVLARKKATVATFNIGNVTNSVGTTTDTGNNTSNENTANAGVVGLISGNALATAGVSTSLNTQGATVNQTCDGCTTATGSNYLTGHDSTNKVIIDQRKSAKVLTTNFGSVTNNVYTTTNTGNNQMNENTIAGDLISGDATATVTVSTNLNSTTVNINQ